VCLCGLSYGIISVWTCNRTSVPRLSCAVHSRISDTNIYRIIRVIVCISPCTIIPRPGFLYDYHSSHATSTSTDPIKHLLSLSSLSLSNAPGTHSCSVVHPIVIRQRGMRTDHAVDTHQRVEPIALPAFRHFSNGSTRIGVVACRDS
jgi:hypothetical protein